MIFLWFFFVDVSCSFLNNRLLTIFFPLLQQSLAKFRGALTEMCIVFEDGLAQFIKNLSSNDSKGSELHREQHHVKKTNGRKRGKKNRRSIQITAQDVGDAEEAATEDIATHCQNAKEAHETEAGDAHADIYA